MTTRDIEAPHPDLETVLKTALQLSALDRMTLVEQVLATVKSDLQENAIRPRKTYKGVLQGLNISNKDIDEMRRDAWANFPREDG